MSEDDRSTRHSTVADNASSYNGEDTLYYDPEQDEDERRRVRSKMRDNVRNLNGT